MSDSRPFSASTHAPVSAMPSIISDAHVIVGVDVRAEALEVLQAVELARVEVARGRRARAR